MPHVPVDRHGSRGGAGDSSCLPGCVLPPGEGSFRQQGNEVCSSCPLCMGSSRKVSGRRWLKPSQVFRRSGGFGHAVIFSAANNLTLENIFGYDLVSVKLEAIKGRGCSLNERTVSCRQTGFAESSRWKPRVYPSVESRALTQGWWRVERVP